MLLSLAITRLVADGSQIMLNVLIVLSCTRCALVRILRPLMLNIYASQGHMIAFSFIEENLDGKRGSPRVASTMRR